MKIIDLLEDKFEYTTEKQILIRIRQILYDRKLSGTESNAGELNMLRRKLKDLRSKKDVTENFADGKGPGRAGDSQRHGIPKHATMAQLEKAAKSSGRKGQLARWQINMRRGKKRANESRSNKKIDFLNIYTKHLMKKYPKIKLQRKQDCLIADDLFIKADILVVDDKVGVSISSAHTGKYTGCLAPAIKETTEQLLKQYPNATPILDVFNDNSNGAWKHIANKLGYNLNVSYEESKNTVLTEADTVVSIMDKPVDILINPGYQRMLAMAKTANFPRLRALYVPSQDLVVVWPAELAIHYQMAEALVDQLKWNLGSDLKSAMTHHRLVDPMHPQSAILQITPPMTDHTGKIKRDTNIHKRAGDFSVVALPKFYNIDWWQRIKRTAPQVTESWSQKYKKSINCDNPQGFSQRAHCAARKKRRAGGKTTSKPVREEQAVADNVNDRLEKATAQLDLAQMPTVNGGTTLIVNLDGRPIVVVNFNGHHIPFYCSTGRGGKTDVATGKWYPFWGIASDGWFNKGTGTLINNYYNSPALAHTAQILDHTLGNMLTQRNIPMAGVSAVAVINQDQKPTAYRDAAQNLIKYYAQITDQVRKITANN